MIVVPASLSGAFVLDLERREDERGWFARAFCAEELGRWGMNPNIAQVNISSNRRRGTIRGMHYQRDPHGETKVVRVTRGAIFDVIVDVRTASPTFGRWFGLELSAATGRSLYVPHGFAHGFQTLTDDVEITYLMGSEYVPGAATGIRHDDPDVAIAWPEAVTDLSPADRALPWLKP